MNIIQRYFIRRSLRKHGIAFTQWHHVTSQLPLICTLSSRQKARLRLLSTLLIKKKAFIGANDFAISDEMRICIAAQACVPILNIGLNAYAGWLEIIVYPDAFMVSRDVVDDIGLVHHQRQGLRGESWGRGPVILSWQDVQHDSYQLRPGHNIVIHEFAHKLDMGSGRANGLPPLPANMSTVEWKHALTEAYNNLSQRLEHHQHTYINAYAATDAAEFFAVSCEYYFTAPQILEKHCPRVFLQLESYFKQVPAEKNR
jgi:Mlc titration factor MtfA (ptsG expression regulator)